LNKTEKPVKLLKPEEFSEELNSLKPFMHSEFTRLPRSLEKVEFWKATEFRAFVLYIGPVVLKGRLKKSFYNHFMLLHCAIRLLISSETYHTHNSLDKTLLNKFVHDYSYSYC